MDVIEAGFPFASPGDFAAVQRIAQQVGGDNGPMICGLARASRATSRPARMPWRLRPRRRIHTFIATSDIHLEHKLRKSRKEVLGIVPDMVAYARSLVDDVEFSCEDAGRSDPEFLRGDRGGHCSGCHHDQHSRHRRLHHPERVRCADRWHQSARAQHRRCRVVRCMATTISVWPVANFLEAVKNGARQLECTINGIGERAGNAASRSW